MLLKIFISAFRFKFTHYGLGDIYHEEGIMSGIVKHALAYGSDTPISFLMNSFFFFVKHWVIFAVDSPEISEWNILTFIKHLVSNLRVKYIDSDNTKISLKPSDIWIQAPMEHFHYRRRLEYWA